ncbi:hypothetical protein [Clostridium sp.]|uniref:hypothetical protein n=1 Tax=Clostridium sp. TaxID=1506 RepID=UPI002FCABA0A
MVHLKNIIYENEIIKCFYSPEKCGEYGYIEYDIKNNKILDLKQTKYEGNKQFYYMNVKSRLESFEKDKKFPSEYNLVIF